MIARADAARLPLRDKSVDLVIGSPPYGPQRTYGIGAARDFESWVRWMLDVTHEAVRVSRGLVIWVVAGWTKDWRYNPGPEALLTEAHRAGIVCWRPVYWHRYGIMGSGGAQWYRADVEYALAFAPAPGLMPYGDPKANGHKPKYESGGAPSNRMADGRRANRRERISAEGGRLKKPHGERRMGGEIQAYIPPDLANPGNLLHTETGGGKMGHALAHENEAPYHVDVPSFFVNSHSHPGSFVLDPFSGSGTTWDACLELDRRFIGFDLRQSQCLLSRKRAATVTPGLPFERTGA